MKWDRYWIAVIGGTRYWYRRLLRRCIICGGPRVYPGPGGWTSPTKYACGWCNKRIQHGMNYGMGAERLNARR